MRGYRMLYQKVSVKPGSVFSASLQKAVHKKLHRQKLVQKAWSSSVSQTCQ